MSNVDLFGLEACREQEAAIRAEEAQNTPITLTREQYNIFTGNCHSVDRCTAMIRGMVADHNIPLDLTIMEDAEFIERNEMDLFMVGDRNWDDYQERDANSTDWVVGFTPFEIIVESINDAIHTLVILRNLMAQDIQPWNLSRNRLDTEYFIED
ncbi:nucleoside/nucleotide kinase family protein [Vibrio phage VAP7]|uniref:Nucleoside/nucleotide kinase family protein n=1 Tax=Vibrio phage VAP7 TaxID=2584487 RepID=A0A4Y5TV45_9CAUD|nr:nucleoside/nucleotide kinase family protein [Vibrio phage VAP7]QDB73233.1 nucleoside/nucleotide kinase family protein [Vibrio phage VAP7]UFD98082.1 hypothetical protein [Vibrio phage BX-1]